MNHKF